jgi:uncharacterized protein YndB with AHSA1/START domain
MATTTLDETIHVLNISRVTQIDAPPEITFEAVLAELGPESQLPDGRPFPFELEPWPGGRWYRDLGEGPVAGGRSGHFWGHVQVIKPPALLEICGPLFMSYPAVNFVRYRLTAEAGGTRLEFSHQAIGLITAEHREGVVEGWAYGLERLKEIAKRLAGQRSGAKR